jgi:N-acetylmuramoyl-L-alanine amidase CwlA
MHIVKNLTKITVASALLLGLGGTYANIEHQSNNTLSHHTVDAKTLPKKTFTTHRSAKKKSNLPKSIHYSKRVKKNKTMHITYSGTLKRKSIKKSGNKYVATYSGTLNGHWS